MSLFLPPKAWAAQAARATPFRIPNEFYPTPPEATRALLSVESFDGDIWEPACGNGQIAKVLSDHGYTVVSTDLHAYGVGTSGIDFLRETAPRAKHIVTNPPYGSGLANVFVAKALELSRMTGGNVAMLLNLASLCHPTRTQAWQERPPARLYAVDDVVCWPQEGYGPAPAYFRKHRYVWAVWTPDHTGPSAFWWLSGSAFRDPSPNRTMFL